MPPPQPTEIHANDIFLIRAQWKLSDDVRPCLVLKSLRQHGVVRVAFLSSAMDLLDQDGDFVIWDSDPDFAATGLKKTSYIPGRQPGYDVKRTELGRRLGCLSGELLKEFDRWSRL